MDITRIRTADGADIATRVFAPDAAAATRGSVVIGAAMGVRQDFYAPFATWLATKGWRVTTFDYRGSGDSLAGSLRGFKADLFDWTRDYEAVIDVAHDALPGQPLYLLGHSLGAQLPGLLGNQHKVSGLLSVASGSGYWRDTTAKLQRVGPYFWWVVVPLATKLFGYFPGGKLRKVGDLPKGVIMQWRKWCLTPRYSVGAEGELARQRYATARFPVLAISMTDDEMMTLRGTQTLVDMYENSPREVLRVTPAELSVRRIGHFGAFRSEHEKLLWPRVDQWLSGLKGAAA